MSDFTLSEDPFSLFRDWFEEAEQSESEDPNAMSLATSDAQGNPNVRIVLLKGFDPRGFTFFTNYESVKGREIEAHPFAAICFHWKSLRRQVRIRGSIQKASATESDDYYNSRAHGSRIGAWASKQSRPLEDRQELEERVEFTAQRFAEGDVPRPENWGGYRVIPVEIEFWHDRPHRLHDRIVFKRESKNKAWSKTRLYP